MSGEIARLSKCSMTMLAGEWLLAAVNSLESNFFNDKKVCLQKERVQLVNAIICMCFEGQSFKHGNDQNSFSIS